LRKIKGGEQDANQEIVVFEKEDEYNCTQSGFGMGAVISPFF
jgi:hypothetical protein